MAEEFVKLSKLTSESEYSVWKIKLMLLFKAKEIDSILEEDGNLKKDFEKKDAKGKLLILCLISEKYMVYAINCKTTKEILEKFDNIFLGQKET